MNQKRTKKLTSKAQSQTPSYIKKIKKGLQSIFSLNDGKSYHYRELIRDLQLRNKKSKDYLKNQLTILEKENKIKKLSNSKYISDKESIHIRGIVDHVNSSFGYVITPDKDDDIWVKTANLNFAIDGDLVNVLITKPAHKGSNPEGKIVSIVKRNRDEFVGRIQISQKFSFVIPDSRNIYFDIMIYPEKIGKAIPNDKVLVKINKWHNAKNRSPVGIVTKVLGQAGENEAEIHSIIANFRLPYHFSEKVRQAADAISDSITEEEIKKRRDFRNIPTFTVDPHDAKDFDDALSIKELDGGKYEIGIHIADVLHYVKEGSIIDKEANERATSIYLVDRTIPMLPERLSNDLCSLKPREDKLTFSSVFEIDLKGIVSNKWFGKTIIHSDRRFTYGEAQEQIEGLDSDFTKKMVTLNNIAKQLRRKRFQKGAINFETIEVEFKLDEKGKPLEVIPKERKDAHKMIEEFMLLANKEVATHVFKWNGQEGKESKTFIYRVHDNPNPEKLHSFTSVAAQFGHKINVEDNVSHNLNTLMETVKGKPEQNVLESLAIRSMAKAKYTTDPRGHFGLAFDHYSHFTSPIRRYPDLMVHRLLEHYLQGGKSVSNEKYELHCIHASEQEKRAADAERASVKYKQVEFMQTMLGEELEGIVSGVTQWGIFVEIIETKCEGMIRMRDLDDDFYEFDENRMRVVGRKSKRIITLGNKMKVLIAKTNIEHRTIDLIRVN